MKYTWRENYKNKDEDLLKARWYLNYYLEKLDATQSVLDLKHR